MLPCLVKAFVVIWVGISGHAVQAGYQEKNQFEEFSFYASLCCPNDEIFDMGLKKCVQPEDEVDTAEELRNITMNGEIKLDQTELSCSGQIVDYAILRSDIRMSHYRLYVQLDSEYAYHIYLANNVTDKVYCLAKSKMDYYVFRTCAENVYCMTHPCINLCNNDPNITIADSKKADIIKIPPQAPQYNQKSIKTLLLSYQAREEYDRIFAYEPSECSQKFQVLKSPWTYSIFSGLHSDHMDLSSDSYCIDKYMISNISQLALANGTQPTIFDRMDITLYFQSFQTVMLVIILIIIVRSSCYQEWIESFGPKEAREPDEETL